MVNGLSILVAEDELIVQAVTQSVLEQHGFDVLCASSTEEALDIVEGDVPLAAVFLDIDIGDKGGGYRVARRVRTLHPDIPIIYTSGGDLEIFERERVSNTDFVPKPYSADQVGKLIECRVSA